MELTIDTPAGVKTKKIVELVGSDDAGITVRFDEHAEEKVFTPWTRVWNLKDTDGSQS